MPPFNDALRLSVRLPVFVLFLLTCVATILALRVLDLFLPQPLDRAPFAKRYLGVLCRLLGFTLTRHGKPCAEAGLLVSNHISWVDIAVLGACVPLRFLSKSEVASWPVIGWIARDIGTLFITRAGGKAAEVREQIVKALGQDHRVLVFPEGTTTAGTQVLPFRGRLLGAAREAERPIQAVTLAYRRDGRPDLIVPFIGEDSFPSHLVRLLSKPAVRVDVVFHPPLQGTELGSQALAETLQRQTATGLATCLRVPPSSPSDRSRHSLAKTPGGI